MVRRPLYLWMREPREAVGFAGVEGLVPGRDDAWLGRGHGPTPVVGVVPDARLIRLA